MEKAFIKWTIREAEVTILRLVLLITNLLIKRENGMDRIILWPDLMIETFHGNTVSIRDVVPADVSVLFGEYNTECILYKNSPIDDLIFYSKVMQRLIFFF